MIIRPQANIQRFTAAHHPGFEYLGTVQREMQIGALARTSEGTYVQVNGSFVERLDTAEVKAALSAAGVRPASAANPALPPTVIVRRKRRVIEAPESPGDKRCVTP